MERRTLFVAEDGTPLVDLHDRRGQPVVQMEAPESPDSAAVRITDATGITHSFPSVSGDNHSGTGAGWQSRPK